MGISDRHSSGDEIPKRDIGMRCPSMGPPSLYFVTVLRLMPPTEGFPCDEFRKI